MAVATILVIFYGYKSLIIAYIRTKSGIYTKMASHDQFYFLIQIYCGGRAIVNSL